MTKEFAERRAKIIAFLTGLTPREKLIVLACLSNDATISARIPDLAKTVLDMHRAQHSVELRALAETARSNLELRLLARRKGCRLEPADRPADLWRIVYPGDLHGRIVSNTSRPMEAAVTRKQALDILRSLPDQRKC